MTEVAAALGEVVTKTDTQRDAEQVRARQVGDKILDKQGARVIKNAKKAGATPVSELPAGERALYIRAKLKDGKGTGLTAEDLNDSDTGTITIAREKGDDVRITDITGTQRVDGELFYIGKTPDDRDVPIPAKDIVATFTKNNAAALAEEFPDLSQAALVQWIAEGSNDECPVPAAQVELMDVEDIEDSDLEAQMEALDIINQQIDSLKDEIEDFRARGGEQQEPEQFKQLNDLLRDAKISTFTNGSLGILYKAGVLQQIQQLRTPQGELAAATAKKIGGILGEMSSDGTLQAAQQELINTMHASENITDARYDELSQQVARGDSLSVLKAEDVNAIPGMQEMVFGNENMTNNVIDRLIGNPDIDDKTRQALQDAKSGKIGKLSLLLLLLAIPGAVIAATAEGISYLTKNQR